MLRTKYSAISHRVYVRFIPIHHLSLTVTSSRTVGYMKNPRQLRLVALVAALLMAAPAIEPSGDGPLPLHRRAHAGRAEWRLRVA